MKDRVSPIFGLAVAAIALSAAAPAAEPQASPLKAPIPADYKALGGGVDTRVVTDAAVDGGKALRATVTDASKPWKAIVAVYFGGKIKAGDTVKATVQLKLVQPETGVTPKLSLNFKDTAAPYATLASKDVTPTPSWADYELDFVAPRDIDAYSVNFAIHLGYSRQVVDIGRVRLTSTPAPAQ